MYQSLYFSYGGLHDESQGAPDKAPGPGFVTGNNADQIPLSKLHLAR